MCYVYELTVSRNWTLVTEKLFYNFHFRKKWLQNREGVLFESFQIVWRKFREGGATNTKVNSVRYFSGRFTFLSHFQMHFISFSLGYPKMNENWENFAFEHSSSKCTLPMLHMAPNNGRIFNATLCASSL